MDHLSLQCRRPVGGSNSFKILISAFFRCGFRNNRNEKKKLNPHGARKKDIRILSRPRAKRVSHLKTSELVTAERRGGAQASGKSAAPNSSKRSLKVKISINEV